MVIVRGRPCQLIMQPLIVADETTVFITVAYMTNMSYADDALCVQMVNNLIIFITDEKHITNVINAYQEYHTRNNNGPRSFLGV